MSKLSPLHRCLALSFLMAACGGATGSDDGNGGSGADGGAGECVATAEEEVSCSDGIDNDCDGKTDCENVECAFDSACMGGGGGGGTAGCGEATYSGDPLAIPDGVGMSYETSVTIDGFDPGQTLLSADGFVSACVTMEHSWLRDLQIEMICPSGQLVVLQQFLVSRLEPLPILHVTLLKAAGYRRKKGVDHSGVDGADRPEGPWTNCFVNESCSTDEHLRKFLLPLPGKVAIAGHVAI